MQKSDIQIASGAKMLPIENVAKKVGLSTENIEFYGKYKAKIDINALKNTEKKDGKLILVTAITPTAAGEGKTTVTIGLGDALAKMGKNPVIALREPSLGPVFGIKGGAAGGGYAQVVPMEDINLHFTGDMHAIGVANNLIAAMLDNHIQQGNTLGIDVKNITWKRCVDMNDRQLRQVINGLGGRVNGVPREDGFDITVASEIMAILCLARDITDLKQRVGRIVVGYNFAGEPVTAGDLKAEGAVAALLKDAIKPNLVQTLENTPAIVHGGPFANIAHGCNSVIATKTALKIGDYVVTEAGFGADLGAEKFFDIKCRAAGIDVSAVVIVATVRALKMHGGAAKSELATENLEALKGGMPNLQKHIENIKDVFGLPCVVAINKFPTDTVAEVEMIKNECEKSGIKAVLCEVHGKGGEGGKALAEQVLAVAENQRQPKFAYENDVPLTEKIKAVAAKVYGASDVEFSKTAAGQLEKLTSLGYGKLPVCIAKTQYSFSDDPARTGRPEGFSITVKSVKVSAGAGFVVCLTGDVMTMPGLPRVPSAEKIDVDKDGKISGLF